MGKTAICQLKTQGQGAQEAITAFGGITLNPEGKKLNDKNAGWVATTASPYILPRQGWKIHISSQNGENAKRIANAVIPFLLKNNLNWKIRRYINRIDELGTEGTQAGKFM